MQALNQKNGAKNNIGFRVKSMFLFDSPGVDDIVFFEEYPGLIDSGLISSIRCSDIFF